MTKYKIGYTQGTYDLFHIGHLNLLEHAKEQCDYLIVGINSNDLVQQYKNCRPIIDEKNRARIVGALKCVDKVIIVDTLDKEEMYKKIKFDCIFIGSDWKLNSRWQQTIETMKKYNVPVIFLPHTDNISTTILRKEIAKNGR